ncbi:MAG: hypothetical protein ACLRFH_00435 [Opitutales bacterium]
MTTTTKQSNFDLIKVVLSELRKKMGTDTVKPTDKDLDLFAKLGDQLSQGKIFLKDALKIPQSQLDMFYAMGYDFYQRNKYENAETIFTFLVLVDPLEEKYLEGLGAAQKQLRKVDLAIAAYGMLTQIKPKRAIHFLNLAECFFYRKQFKEASQCCETMLFLAETFPQDNPNSAAHIQKAKLFLNALNKKSED